MRTKVTVVCVALCLASQVAIAQTTFVDSANRSVVLPARVDRVFAAGFPAEVLLYTLVPEKLAGRNHLPEPDARPFFPEAYRDPVAITQLPDLPDGSRDAQLLALKPDLYIDYGTVHEDYVASVSSLQQRTGIPAIILDGALGNIPSTFRRLGAAIGVRDRGERLAARAEGLLAKYRGALARGRRPVRVYLACSQDGTIPCAADDTASEQLSWLGAVNVAGTSASRPGGPMTVDAIRALEPDVILVGGPAAASRLLADPQWRSVGAVAASKVYSLPALPYNWGGRPPSVNRLPGLTWLAYRLADRPFDAAFDADVQSFFQDFYHVELSEAQLRRLAPK
ncbi:MAG: ABC transporter substrate-binding protein [Vicinamibacterales bacterium]